MGIIKKIFELVNRKCHFCGKNATWGRDFWHGKLECTECWGFQYSSAYPQPFRRDILDIFYLRQDRRISKEKYIKLKAECLEKVRTYKNERDKRKIKRLEKGIQPYLQKKVKKTSLQEHPFPDIKPLIH